MKTTLAEQVAKIMKTYNNPKDYRALVKAIEGLIQTHIDQQGSRSVAELAVATCLAKPKHKASRVVCHECFEPANTGGFENSIYVTKLSAEETDHKEFWVKVPGGENAV